jgi:hypothetical protein
VKSDSWLVIELGGALLFVAVLSFFLNPVYVKSVDRITDVLAIAFTSVISYKFGRSMPQQVGDPKAGQSSRSEVITKSSVPTPSQDVQVPDKGDLTG